MKTKQSAVSHQSSTKSAVMPGFSKLPGVMFLACTILLGLHATTFAAIVTGTINSGGGHASSAAYGMDASVGYIVGDSSGGSVKSMAGGTTTQPAAATNLLVNATPSPVNEASTNQLSGMAALDDGTVSALSGSDIGWSIVEGPVAAISSNGVATTANVFADTPATVRGQYLGASNSVAFVVNDSDLDNYGLYAADAIPDVWQVHYFGTENPLGMASTTNCTGENNLYSYTADLDPTNPASFFQIIAISNLPPGQLIRFGQTTTGRVYRLLYKTSLMAGVWTNVADQAPTPGQAGVTTLSDTNAASTRFYHIQVQVP